MSPVINYTLQQIITGNFTMDTFKYELKDEKNVGSKYSFTP